MASRDMLRGAPPQDRYIRRRDRSAVAAGAILKISESGADMLAKSYYLTLGVPRSESASGIRQAFREQVKRYHPDRVGEARARFFHEIVEAYHTLSNPERRRDYDRGLSHAEFSSSTVPPPVALADENCGGLPQLFPELRISHVKDSYFEAALTRVSRNLTRAKPGESISPERLTAHVILSPAEALQGGALTLRVPSCSPCGRCGGAGVQGIFPCDLCDGEGLWEEQESLRVPIPPNVGDGTLIEVPLRGLGPHNFYLCVCVRVIS